jgi:16S rRNA (guanine527-N7)-methyltransferase
MNEPRAPFELDLYLRGLEAPASFLERCEAYGLGFEEGELERYGHFLAHLLDANRKMNLTGVTDPEEAWTKHVFDALTLVPVLGELGDGARVVDVGSGGGVPGIVLAIALPGVSFTLIDATTKKTAFLGQVAAALRLENIEVVTARAERLGQDRGEKTGTGRAGGHRGAYDAVVARAVGPLHVLAELTVPLAKVGGLCALVKGGRAEEELADAKAALHALHAAHAGTVDTPTGKIVVLEKLRETPKMYPRREGEPKRAPIS